MNIEERVELRRVNYMKHTDDQIDQRQTFHITLRKEKRKDFIKSCRISRLKSIDTKMEEYPDVLSIMIQLIDSLHLTIPDSDLLTKLESIKDLCSENILENLFKSPRLLLNILQFLNHNSDKISFIVAKILVLLLSSKKENKAKLIEIFPISYISSFITISKPKTAIYLIRSLSILAGESSHFCMMLSQEGILRVLFDMLKSMNDLDIFKECSLFYLNFSINYKDIKLQIFQDIILGVKYLIKSENNDVLIDVLITLNNLLQNNLTRIKQFMSIHITDRIIQLVNHTEHAISERALKVLGDCAMGDVPQINILLEHNLLDLLLQTTSQGRDIMRKESFYIISNIIASGVSFIDVLIEHQISLKIIESLEDQNLAVLKELSFVYLNISSIGKWNHLKFFANQGVFIHLKSALIAKPAEIVVNFLKFCFKILSAAKDHKAFEVFDMFQDSGCIDIVGKKSKEMNLEIYNMVSKILDFFISDESNSPEAMNHETPLSPPSYFMI
jgi:hypothetical protein